MHRKPMVVILLALVAACLFLSWMSIISFEINFNGPNLKHISEGEAAFHEDLKWSREEHVEKTDQANLLEVIDSSDRVSKVLASIPPTEDATSNSPELPVNPMKDRVDIDAYPHDETKSNVKLITNLNKGNPSMLQEYIVEIPDESLEKQPTEEPRATGSKRTTIDTKPPQKTEHDSVPTTAATNLKEENLDRKTLSPKTETKVATTQRLLTAYSETQMKRDSGRGYKTILLYTSLFGNERWVDLNDKQIVDYPQRAKCPHAETCKLTYDKNEIHYAEGVLFHAVDLAIMKKYDLSHLLSINKLRPTYQRWIFLSQETPLNYNLFRSHTNLFNWTMTYEHNADIFYPYNHYHLLTEEEKKSVPVKDWSAGKDSLIVWTVSNCGNIRENYVKALKKWIKVTIYGKCAKSLGSEEGTCKRDSEDCLKIIKRHKFVLAFENSFCKDYITEKFWSSLATFENVPVVFGANYSPKIVPPGSYIDTADFPSVKAMADYLLYLDRNSTAYNEYFKWKQTYGIGNADKYCLLCESVHRQNAPSKFYQQVWSVEKSCRPFETKLAKYKEMLQREG